MNKGTESGKFNVSIDNKKQTILLFIIAVTAFLLLSLRTNQIVAQQSSTCEQAYLIVKIAEKHHYSPRPIDEHFSELVFNEFLKLLDSNGELFTKEEIALLDSSKYSLGDNILNKKCSFVDEVSLIYKKKIQLYDSLIKSISNQTIDFSKQDNLFYQDEITYPSQDQLTDKWIKLIKFNILSVYFSNIDSLSASAEATDLKLEEAKKKTIKQFTFKTEDRLNSSGGIEGFVASCYLKAVASAFDPHTNYFTPSEEDEFLNMLSKRVFAFGFEIYANDANEIEIDQIIPRSPAWNSGKLNEGDIIISLIAENGDVNKLEFLNMEEIAALMTSEENQEISLLIRKKNKKEVNVTLTKEKIDVEENIIKSFILEGEQNIGYIYLPVFYVEMGDMLYSVEGSANDLAKELIRLKSENINGLIIDLRDNGGGSMLEAIKMAGIFIDYGALGMVHMRDQEPVTLKDINRGTIYDKPLIVLINKFSASASELFASAMQDHNRAVIVGTNSFGKSTAQEIVPMNTHKHYSYQDQNNGSSAYLKLTTGTFYRVNGKSHQKEGIIPDVKLPNLFETLYISESTFPSALEPTSIDKKTYYYPLDPLPINELKTLSEERLISNSSFIYIKMLRDSIAAEKKQYSIPLDFESFGKYYNSDDMYYSFEEPSPIKDTTFQVINPAYFTKMNKISEAKKENNDNSILQIEEDIYIIEAYNIINDLINYNKK